MPHKVNFCKFTNETRNTFEAAGAESGQPYICAIKGSCAGGGYELALACDHIILTDDGSTSVALPEVPLLAVLPGTGGLTRVTDKRKVRRDLADVFCSIEEGVKGKRALEWRLVDEVVANANSRRRSRRAPQNSRRRPDARAREGRRADAAAARRSARTARCAIRWSRWRSIATRASRRSRFPAPTRDAPASIAALHAEGASTWLLRLARELDDAILHLRLNELEIGVLVFKSQGDARKV